MVAAVGYGTTPEEKTSNVGSIYVMELALYMNRYKLAMKRPSLDTKISTLSETKLDIAMISKEYKKASFSYHPLYATVIDMEEESVIMTIVKE